jgi:hypothetical protein
MRYLFRGRLCGYICARCPESVSHAKIRLYRLRADQQETALATASPKDTFRVLDRKAVDEKQGSLIAEAETDADGNFSVELDERQKYDGGPFELDVYLESVPGLPQEGAPAREPVQFTITTLQPQWRQRDDLLVWGWEYCIPHRLWCWIRGLFGAWTICGTVKVCDTGAPVGGVKVFAFDRDWLQDDPLGSAVTNGAGSFRIDYTTATFRQGTFLDVELFGGPDIYFRVETAAGTVLLAEPGSRGREPDRENAGPCFCVDLCLKEPPDGGVPSYPVFTHIGGYKYSTQIDSAPAGSGLTLGDGRAFYSAIRLNGVLSKTLGGNPMEYQFEVRELDAGGSPIGAWTTVAPGQIAPTNIGTWEKFEPAFPGDPDPIKTKDYVVNGVPGPEVLVPAIVGGWIRVPQENNVFGPTGSFVPNGNMIRLDTRTLSAFPSVDLTGLVAGSSSTSTGQALAQNRHFSIRLRVREVGTATPGLIAGTCQHVAINDTLYDNILRHPSWMPVALSNQLGVAMLDLSQLMGSGCSEIAGDLDVLFTAAHPTLGAVSISMSGPGGPYGFTLPAAVAGERFGTATPGFTVADLAPCAYIVTLSVQLLLTTGDSIPSDLIDQIAFCKA